VGQHAAPTLSYAPVDLRPTLALRVFTWSLLVCSAVFGLLAIDAVFFSEEVWGVLLGIVLGPCILLAVFLQYHAVFRRGQRAALAAGIISLGAALVWACGIVLQIAEAVSDRVPVSANLYLFLVALAVMLAAVVNGVLLLRWYDTLDRARSETLVGRSD
jgi:hypothetical protein